MVYYNLTAHSALNAKHIVNQHKSYNGNCDKVDVGFLED